MSSEDKEYSKVDLFFMGWFIGFGVGLLLFLFAAADRFKEEGYKKGQIDCQNNKINVRKEMQPDSSVLWVIDEQFEW